MQIFKLGEYPPLTAMFGDKAHLLASFAIWRRGKPASSREGDVWASMVAKCAPLSLLIFHLPQVITRTHPIQICDDMRMVLWAQFSRGETFVQAVLQEFDQSTLSTIHEERDIEQEEFESTIQDADQWTFDTLDSRRQKQILMARLCYTFPDSPDFGVAVVHNSQRIEFQDMTRQSFMESLPTALETRVDDCIFCDTHLKRDDVVHGVIYVCRVHAGTDTSVFLNRNCLRPGVPTVHDRVVHQALPQVWDKILTDPKRLLSTRHPQLQQLPLIYHSAPTRSLLG